MDCPVCHRRQAFQTSEVDGESFPGVHSSDLSPGGVRPAGTFGGFDRMIACKYWAAPALIELQPYVLGCYELIPPGHLVLCCPNPRDGSCRDGNFP